MRDVELNRPNRVRVVSNISHWFLRGRCSPATMCAIDPLSLAEFSCLPCDWPLSVWYSISVNRPNPAHVTKWQWIRNCVWFWRGQSVAHTNSPKVGDAPQAINVSSADITIDVFEHPILVMCHPVWRKVFVKNFAVTHVMILTYRTNLGPALDTCSLRQFSCFGRTWRERRDRWWPNCTMNRRKHCERHALTNRRISWDAEPFHLFAQNDPDDRSHRSPSCMHVSSNQWQPVVGTV